MRAFYSDPRTLKVRSEIVDVTKPDVLQWHLFNLTDFTLDEQSLQWAKNEYKVDKHLPYVDETYFLLKENMGWV